MPQLPQILAAEVLVLVVVRGIGPAVFYPLAAPDPQSRRRLGWMLLPRGGLLFELVYHPGGGLVDLLAGPAAQLLRQFAVADMLLHLLVFSTVAALVQHFSQPATPGAAVGEATAAVSS